MFLTRKTRNKIQSPADIMHIVLLPARRAIMLACWLQPHKPNITPIIITMEHFMHLDKLGTKRRKENTFFLEIEVFYFIQIYTV